MREVSEAVKRAFAKLEGATQKSQIWGQIWGQIDVGGIIRGDKMNNIV